MDCALAFVELLALGGCELALGLGRGELGLEPAPQLRQLAPVGGDRLGRLAQRPLQRLQFHGRRLVRAVAGGAELAGEPQQLPALVLGPRVDGLARGRDPRVETLLPPVHRGQSLTHPGGG